MDRNNKLIAITKAIQEAVPDVMELKLGCKVEAEFYSLNPDISETWTEVLTLNGNHQNSRWYHFIETDAQSETIVKILGSPIGIREVMLWLKRLPQSLLLECNGNIVAPEHEGGETFCTYDLQQDSLEKQSDEFIDFLYSLTQP